MNAMHPIPVVDSYLRDLDQALKGREEQPEVLESIREHIEEALARSSDSESDADRVRQVLNELGPVERIVAALPTESGTAISPVQGTAPIQAGLKEAVWPDALILIIALLALLSVFPFYQHLLIYVPAAVATLTWAVVGLIRVARPSRRLMFFRVTATVSIITLVLMSVMLITLSNERAAQEPDGPIRVPPPVQPLETTSP